MKKTPSYKYDYLTFLDYAGFDAPLQGEENKLGTESRKHDADRWRGTETWEEAQEYFRNGNPDAKWDEVDAEGAQLNTQNHVRQLSRRYNVVGGSVHVGRYLEGRPECMVQRQFIDTEKPIKTIFIDCGILGDVDEKDVYRWSLLMSAAVEAAQASGIYLHIYVGKKWHVRSGMILLEVEVKKPEEKINMNALSMAFHPSFNRRLMWNWLEYWPEHYRMGYGASQHMRPSDVPDKLLIGYKQHRLHTAQQLFELLVHGEPHNAADNA